MWLNIFILENDGLLVNQCGFHLKKIYDKIHSVDNKIHSVNNQPDLWLFDLSVTVRNGKTFSGI